MTTFDLSFPSDFRAEAVRSFLMALSGILKSGSNFLGNTTITFELVGTDVDISHRLKVPSSHADQVVRQLRTLVPGIRVELAGAESLRRWDYVAEIGMTRPSRSLHVPKPELLAASLLASVQTLGENEAVMMQLVISSAGRIKQPKDKKPVQTGNRRLDRLLALGAPGKDALNDQKTKAADANYLGAFRLAGRSNRPGGAEHLVQGVQQVLASADSGHNRLRRRPASANAVQRRLSEAAGFPATVQLSAMELSGMIAWPVGNPHVAGLPAGQTRHLPATGAIARSGLVIGDSNYPGAKRPLALSLPYNMKHIHVIGPSGVGKSTLCANLAAQIMQAGHGLILVEAKRDLYVSTLDLVPAHRVEDVIVLDVMGDGETPLGFNIMNDGNPRGAVERICALFERLYHDTRGVWTRELLYMGLSTLATDPKYTFVDLAPLLIPMTPEESDWRDEVIRSVSDMELRNFWQRFQGQPKSMQERIAQPVMDRIWQLARPEIRNVIGQSQSSFDMNEVVRDGRILLVNLAELPEATASLAGTLLLNSAWAAVQASASAGGMKQPLHLVLDEFQSFVTLPISPEEWFAKARSFGCGIVASHQHLGQLPMELRSAIMANARSKVCFQLSADDAMTFSREFGRSVDPDDFMNLGAYEVICRLATGASVSQPVTGITRPPSPSTGVAGEVRELSRNRYGRPAHLVEKEIAERRRPGNTQLPKLGPTQWDR